MKKKIKENVKKIEQKNVGQKKFREKKIGHFFVTHRQTHRTFLLYIEDHLGIDDHHLGIDDHHHQDHQYHDH